MTVSASQFFGPDKTKKKEKRKKEKKGNLRLNMGNFLDNT
jgi:hypothetical protein